MKLYSCLCLRIKMYWKGVIYTLWLSWCLILLLQGDNMCQFYSSQKPSFNQDNCTPVLVIFLSSRHETTPSSRGHKSGKLTLDSTCIHLSQVDWRPEDPREFGHPSWLQLFHPRKWNVWAFGCHLSTINPVILHQCSFRIYLKLIQTQLHWLNVLPLDLISSITRPKVLIISTTCTNIDL